MAQQTEVRGRATAIFTDEEGYTNIVYHNTRVVRFNEKEIILNSGGWRTSTTKTRMNQAACQFRLGFRVEQKDGEWNVYLNQDEAGTYQTVTMFYDRIKLSRENGKAKKTTQEVCVVKN